eukprot:3057281-Ditylum_brightwellii.AAC.1
MSKDKVLLDNEVSVPNLLPFNLFWDDNASQESAETTTTIEYMLGMPTTKHSKLLTSMSTKGLCKSMENLHKCLAKWMSYINHNYKASLQEEDAVEGKVSIMDYFVKKCNIDDTTTKNKSW